MPETPGKPSETYTPGYTANASDFMANRQAATHATFFLPYLRYGFAVLDCGCGPGTITAGLARHVAPGSVTGIDLAESQIALAQANAQRQHLDNLTFRAG
ncbi:MAG TPA: class I SAM-dependent methyltransferase, partial [Phototrophicaceae bacterium]|nr:class I SAM-dependent methyltransferase [Phototrophicaceae bacterium]